MWLAFCKRIRHGYGSEAVRMKRKQIYERQKRRSQTDSVWQTAVRVAHPVKTTRHRSFVQRKMNMAITKGQHMTKRSRCVVDQEFNRTFRSTSFLRESPPWKIITIAIQRDRKRDRIASTDVYAFGNFKMQQGTWVSRLYILVVAM